MSANDYLSVNVNGERQILIIVSGFADNSSYAFLVNIDDYNKAMDRGSNSIGTFKVIKNGDEALRGFISADCVDYIEFYNSHRYSESFVNPLTGNTSEIVKHKYEPFEVIKGKDGKLKINTILPTVDDYTNNLLIETEEKPYLYITTFQGDNHKFYGDIAELKEKISELDFYLK